jgi:hypothetical protein
MRHTIALLLTVLTLGAMSLGLLPAEAQQAPPAWKQGQSADMASSPLSPHAQPPAPKAPGEIPVDTIRYPPASR